MVVLFDAWQYQCLDPPWWWLIKRIEIELRRKHGKWRWFSIDWWWRIKQLGREALLGLVAALVVVWVLVYTDAASVIRVAFSVVAGIPALLVLLGTAGDAVRRHLLVESPAGAAAVLRTSDPMAELRALRLPP